MPPVKRKAGKRHAEAKVDAARHARNLLQLIRETPLHRLGRKHPLEALRDRIASALAAEGALPRVAVGVATQLVIKIDKASIGGAATWRAIGRQLLDETSQLREGMAFVDRQVIIVLPKLAPEAVWELYEWLARKEPTVARTILNAAISASVPREMAERYLAQYRKVVGSMAHVEPQLARTIANGTFMARHPIEEARRHLERFERLIAEFDGTDVPVRTLARRACRTPRAVAAGRKFLKDRRMVVDRVISHGTDATIARTIADIASVSADPVAKGDELFGRFRVALEFTKAFHPRAARSIALSACRSPDPIATALRYIENYDRIVELIARHDNRFAHDVAAQAFRSDRPFQMARRFLRERQREFAGRAAIKNPVRVSHERQ